MRTMAPRSDHVPAAAVTARPAMVPTDRHVA